MKRRVLHDVLNVADKGYALCVETSGFDDYGWKTIDLFDRSWGSDRGNPVNGSFWFRKTVNIPPEYAGKEAILRMGYIIDADHTYVNGTLVGHTGYQYPPRIYKIPEGVLKAGKNVIAVRLLSQSWYPGFIHDKPYKIVFDDEEI